MAKQVNNNNNNNNKASISTICLGCLFWGAIQKDTNNVTRKLNELTGGTCSHFGHCLFNAVGTYLSVSERAGRFLPRGWLILVPGLTGKSRTGCQWISVFCRLVFVRRLIVHHIFQPTTDMYFKTQRLYMSLAVNYTTLGLTFLTPANAPHTFGRVNELTLNFGLRGGGFNGQQPQNFGLLSKMRY